MSNVPNERASTAPNDRANTTQNERATANGGHLAPLDGLRGIAIAFVVWFHVWQITWLPADVTLFERTFNFNWIAEDGFVGVDLFFFISGFCLFYPYVRTKFDGTPGQTLATFAYRRAVKILPSYVLAIALFTGFGWATYASLGDEVKQIALHLLFIHTWWDESYGSINGVLWSLAVEVQFYVAFPLIAWAALRRPWWTFAAMAILANAYRLIVQHHYDVVHQMDQLPGTLDLFGAGMLAAYVFRLIAVRAPRLATRRIAWTSLAVAGFVGFWAILQSDFQARVLDGWPQNWHVYGNPLMTIDFIAIALGSMFAFPLWQRVLANPALTFLSAISYNLYLWHQAVARALLVAHVPPWTGASEHADPHWGFVYSFVAFAAAVAVATVVTYAFERPIMRRKPFEPAVRAAVERKVSVFSDAVQR